MQLKQLWQRSRACHPVLRCTVIFAGLLLFLVPPAAADWNTGVGGNAARDGFQPVTGPATPDILWQGSRPAIVSQQGACDGNLLVLSRIASFTIPTGTWIVAHDLTTGD
ncbi:MAG: hypothetical protein GF355_08440, partial [Candidatus Eisenbacteria bacterium]|nr:hypothetical protein [Candidatus Eisenbacteria bacterium]